MFSSGAESGTEGWTAGGFAAVGASQTALQDNYYVISNRQYVSFDKYPKTGPYSNNQNVPFQDGLLRSYWDTSQSDNNTPDHPGAGQILTVDANPQPRARLDGTFWQAGVARYDAPFGLQKSDSFSITTAGRTDYVRGRAAQPLFNDGRRYWFGATSADAVKLPDNGVNIRVLSQKGATMKVRVWKRR